MMFEPHRKHTYRPPQPVTAIALFESFPNNTFKIDFRAEIEGTPQRRKMASHVGFVVDKAAVGGSLQIHMYSWSSNGRSKKLTQKSSSQKTSFLIVTAVETSNLT
jgi:hypothetical protein